MKERACIRCDVVKSLSQFHPAPDCKDGHRLECKTCINEKQRIRNATPENKARVKEYHSRPDIRARQNAARQSPTGKASYWRRAHASPSFALSFALYRALKRGPSKNAVTHADLLEMFARQDGRCALTSIKMTWQRGKLSPTSMSMDRIVPEFGYSLGNVRLICHAVNMFRGQMSDAEMVEMARAIVSKADVESKEPTWDSYLVPSHAQFI